MRRKSSTAPRATPRSGGAGSGGLAAPRAAAAVAAVVLAVGVLLGLADQAAPVGGAEDEEDRAEAEEDRPGGHRDLGADREGEDRGARRASQRGDEERLLGARAARSEGDDVGDRL